MLVILLIKVSVIAYASTTVSKFADVNNKYSWALTSINFVVKKEVVNGVSDNLFAPNSNVTSEQLAKMFTVMFDLKSNNINNNSFIDVNDDRWSYSYVEACKEYFDIRNSRLFHPDNSATREEIIYSLISIIKKNNDFLDNIDIDNSAFVDENNVKAQYVTSIKLSRQIGLVNGYPDNSFGAKKFVTRSEMAVLLYRAYILNENFKHDVWNYLTESAEEAFNNYLKSLIDGNTEENYQYLSLSTKTSIDKDDFILMQKLYQEIYEYKKYDINLINNSNNNINYMVFLINLYQNSNIKKTSYDFIIICPLKKQRYRCCQKDDFVCPFSSKN
jgi:hypothetical protein